MDQALRLKRNSILSFFSATIRIATSAVMFIGVARFYGPEAFGSFSTAFVLSAIFVLIADFGFDTLLTTEVSRKKEKAGDIVNKLFSFKLLFSLISLICIWAIPVFHQTSQLTKSLIFIFSFSVLFNSLTNFFFALFRGLEQFRHETVITFIINSLLLLLLIFLGITKVHLTFVALAFIFTRALGLLLSVYKAQKMVTLSSFRFSLHGWQENKNSILIFGFSLIFGNLFFQLNTPILALLKGDYAVGIFESVFKLIGLVAILSDILVYSMMPTLSYLHETNMDNWLKLSRVLNKTYCMIALPISLFFFIYSEQIISFIYGKNIFNDAIPLMKIAAFIIVIRFVSETYGLMLTTSKRQFSRMIITGIGTISTITLCFLLIPQKGVQGAAIASLIVNILVGIGYMSMNFKHFIKWTLNERYLGLILVTIILGFVLFYMKDFFWIYGIISAVIIYTTTAYYIGYNKQERILLFSFNKQTVI